MKNSSPKTAQQIQQQHQDNGKVVHNPWRQLRSFTDARIGLGRAGISLPTAEMLAFQLSHAQARDAVNFPLDLAALSEQLEDFCASLLHLHSQAVDRNHYLQRPDLGRKLDQASRDQLSNYMSKAATATELHHDIAIVIVDGLSSLAVQKNAHPFLVQLLTILREQPEPWRLAPISLVEQGRVAIGDDIGELLNAKVVLVLIGERPGLSSPDSLGLYLTWQPKTGLNDACRNCISNIRPAGLSYQDAAQRTLYLLQEAKRLNLSGVGLKDRSQDDVIEHQTQTTNFLLSE
ncbi:MAG: ethanolamine ammonia-lyase small subunit [Pseudoalteromonas rhizosphaerae]|jgi:ethanolamine ammonia-lyase small subunit|uniref:Ethanolamine ammonia-lyase small subunit n=1 Tax=Pseudoalteromonas neustonica TaxID=1840331 RepID=A0ABY3FBI5_9GAMM|nr:MULTISPECIES: ethanolamine ammonia-lyase subunit EutC [Pseudoalteromonas]MBB1294364.1 ethanolamine ammonia-lyase subunit EutC [Pseudoalteromonas sp. SR41-4]TVU82181.1 ethanolamine ammonia-lyase subunit EutC [Pseudoalteromonas neustonica]